MSKITYQNKVDLSVSEIALINKIVADDMNSIKKAINENSNFSILLNGTNAGELKCTLQGNLEMNDMFNIFIPTQSSNLTSNAKLSIDNGTTYKNIVYFDGENAKLGELSNTSKNVYYDGQNFVLCDSEYTREYDANWTVKKYSDGYVEMIHNFLGTFNINGEYLPSPVRWVQTPVYQYPITLTKLVSANSTVGGAGHLIGSNISGSGISLTGYSLYIYDFTQILNNYNVRIYTKIIGKWR